MATNGAKKGFNPRSVQDTDRGEFSVLDPETKRPTGAFITVASPEHPDAKKIRFENERRVRKDMEKAQRLVLSDPEADEARELGELVTVTLGWRGFTEDNGDDIPYTKETATALYTELGWLREQVRDARKDRALFIKRSAPN